MQRKTFIAVGDVHGHTGNLARIPGLSEADGLIITGDLTNHGGPDAVHHILDEAHLHNGRVLAQIGNMDLPTAEQALDEAGANIHRRGFELFPGVGIMGVGFSTPTPFSTPSEVSDEQLARWLRQTYVLIDDLERFILVSHTPPIDTACDMIGSGVHVGSRAVRAFIEQHQPAVCLTGHIHESVGTDSIGKTVITNPGPLATGGYVRLTVDEESITAEVLRIPAS